MARRVQTNTVAAIKHNLYKHRCSECGGEFYTMKASHQRNHVCCRCALGGLGPPPPEHAHYPKERNQA